MRSRQGLTFAFLGLIWGSEWLVTRAIDQPLLGALGLRYGIAALALLGVIAFRRTGPIAARTSVLSALTGVTMLTVPAILTVWASRRISAGLLVVVLSMTPLIAALIEGRATGRVLAASVGGIGSVALLAGPGLSFRATQWAGGVAVLFAATLIAGSMVALKRQMSQGDFLLVAAIQLGAGAAGALLASAALEGRSAVGWGPEVLGLETGLGLTANALAFPLYYWLLQSRRSFEVASSQWLVMVIGIGESLFFVHAWPSWRLAAGTVAALACVRLLWQAGMSDDAPVTIQITLPPSAT